MDKVFARYLLEKTKKDYNLIAGEYSETRHFTWDVESLAQYAIPGEKILDLGCGNGRLLEVLKDKNIDYIGLDNSEKLIEIAKRNYLHPPKFSVFVKNEVVSNEGKIWRARAKFQVSDALDLPFSDNFFDKVFSTRVLPHIPSKEFQLQFLKGAKRVLKPGGLLILTAWYVYGLSIKRNFLLMLKNAFLKIVGKSELDFGDALIPWNRKVMRYYHFFTKRELQNLAEESGFKIKKIWTTPFDIYLIAEKPHAEISKKKFLPGSTKIPKEIFV